MINWSVTRNEKGTMISVYKTLLRPHLEYWSAHYAKNKALEGRDEIYKNVHREKIIMRDWDIWIYGRWKRKGINKT